MIMRKTLVAAFVLLSTFTLAQGTRTWEQSKFDDFEKGTPKGVAIRSDGTLELAPAMKQVYTTPSTYIWAIASDDRGNVYAAAGAPARVYRITPEGQATVILAPSELQVQALAVDKSGVVYAATSPEGKVYRIEPRTYPVAAAAKPSAPPAPAGAQQNNAAAANNAAPLDPNYNSSIYFDPKTKYIWALAIGPDGRLYVATGDRGEIFRVDRVNTGSVFFKSDEAHIRAIVFDPKGNLIAGSDGSGLIYRISPAGEAFVLYSAPKKEITALALDAQGNIYAAGAGEKRAANANQMGSPSNPILATPTGFINPAGTPGNIVPQIPLPGMGATGSEIYRIAPDGSPKRLWSSREDLVYALGFDAEGHLLAGTGNKGKIYSIDSASQFTDLLKMSANQVIGFARGLNGATYAATSNLGKIFALQNSVLRDGTFESDVFDARIFSRWGRLEARNTGNVEYFARSGNVDNPDRNWSTWKKIDLQKDPLFDAPSARFIQWRAILHSGNPAPMMDSVRVNYLPKNVAPEVDDVSVQVGYRFQATPRTVAQAASSNEQASQQAAMMQNVTPQRDRDSIAVRWTAHDENDDQLSSSIFYRGDNETRWKLLKNDLADRFYTFDAGLLPDGEYTIRIIASDEPAHSPEEASSGTRESSRFEVDNTPPAIFNLAAVVDAGQLHIIFTANDSFSVIRRAEFSIDAGDWQFVAPVGEISDSRQENYDFYIPVPAPVAALAAEQDLTETAGAKNPAGQPQRAKGKRPAPKAAPTVAGLEEHTIVVRLYDRFDNMGTAKVVVPAK